MKQSKTLSEKIKRDLKKIWQQFHQILMITGAEASRADFVINASRFVLSIVVSVVVIVVAFASPFFSAQEYYLNKKSLTGSAKKNDHAPHEENSEPLIHSKPRVSELKSSYKNTKNS